MNSSAEQKQQANEQSEQGTVPPSSGSSVSEASVGGSAPIAKDFGRYQVEKILGEGGMGAVYLATDTQLARQVALKVPKFGDSPSPSAIERFYREARAMATLQHPNLCPVYDVGEVGGVHYLTMAYIQGRTLDTFVAGKGVSQKQAAVTTRKLALALHEAHRANIIHRDLKPANVMIDLRREPIVMDFGLAYQEQREEEARLTQHGSLLGTPAYMAPEQIGGESEGMGPGVDIYSLGVILFELLTGTLPFTGTGTSVLVKVVTEPPPRIRQIKGDVDPWLEAICMKALAKVAEQRFASAQEFATALAAFLKGETSVVRDLIGEEYAPVPRPSDYDTDMLIANFGDDNPEPVAPTPPAPGEVACKNCGSKFNAPSTLAGKTVPCPSCQASLIIPGVAAAQPLVAACQCGARFAAPAQLAGKQVKCPQCGGQITVPKA